MRHASATGAHRTQSGAPAWKYSDCTSIDVSGSMDSQRIVAVLLLQLDLQRWIWMTRWKIRCIIRSNQILIRLVPFPWPCLDKTRPNFFWIGFRPTKNGWNRGKIAKQNLAQSFMHLDLEFIFYIYSLPSTPIISPTFSPNIHHGPPRRTRIWTGISYHIFIQSRPLNSTRVFRLFTSLHPA